MKEVLSRFALEFLGLNGVPDGLRWKIILLILMAACVVLIAAYQDMDQKEKEGQKND